MLTNHWLRVHLVGSDLHKKQKLANFLQPQMRKALHKTSIVNDISDCIRERLGPGDDDHFFFMALESEYYKLETSVALRRRNLIFTDSIVDRYLRVKKAGMNLDVYFLPRLREAAGPGNLFLYGPEFDDERRHLLGKFNLPFQAWTSSAPEIIEAIGVRYAKFKHESGRN